MTSVTYVFWMGHADRVGDRRGLVADVADLHAERGGARQARELRGWPRGDVDACAREAIAVTRIVGRAEGEAHDDRRRRRRGGERDVAAAGRADAEAVKRAAADLDGARK